ncbi:MAG: hypothetical protein U0872_15280 [Planctomycetaceae bacterium]
MDEVKTATSKPISDLEAAIADSEAMTLRLETYRRSCLDQLHPWSFNSLANAIGSQQNVTCNLKTVLNYLTQPIDAEY